MKIALVGTGLAAQRCAESLRQLGHDGPIAMYGDELPYDRPPLSKAFLAGERPDVRLRPDGWYRDNDVEFREQRITSLDELHFDKVLIATGARPIELPGLPGAHVLRTVADAIRLDEALTRTHHLAIVGAGLIGQEVASAAAKRGIRTTLIDAQPQPFDALMGPGGGHHLQALHEHAGVELKLGRRLVAVDETPTRVRSLQLDDGSRIRPDEVLVAVGVRPATAWTPWPARIPVDASGATPMPGVFAAGDATGSAHWEAAVVGGQNAARGMLGLQPKPHQPPLVWSDQHGVRIQRIGDPTGATPADDLTYAHDGRIKAVVLMNRPEHVRTARRLIQEAA